MRFAVNPKDNLIIQLVLQHEYLTLEQIEECKRIQLEYEKQGKDHSLEEIFLEKEMLTKNRLEEIYKQLSEEVSSRTEVVMLSKENTLPDSMGTLAGEENSQEHTQTVSSKFLKKLQNIGRYKIVKQLGKGGMGVVYKADDELLKRSVAIKVLLQYDAATTIQTKRFLIEAQATASMSHPNIVAVYDIGQLEQENFYLVMEYVDGQSLADIIKERGPLGFSESIEITRQVALALDTAHSLKIIHRDIKPANILINKNGLVKVTDFGLAKMVAASSLGGISYAGQILGTPFYIAPEQIDSSQVDGRADIYSLGITFYQMLTKRLPFEGDDVYSLLLARFKKPPTPITTYNPEIPSAMARIVHRMIEQNPQDRISTAKEVVSQLTKLAQGEHTSIYLKDDGKEEKKSSGLIHIVYLSLFLSMICSYFLPFSSMMQQWQTWNAQLQQKEAWEKIQTLRNCCTEWLLSYQKFFPEAKKDLPQDIKKPEDPKVEPKSPEDPKIEEGNNAIIQDALVLLKVETLFPKTDLKSYTAFLDGQPWKDTILKAGTYQLKIEHPGYFPLQKQITIPTGPGIFIHKEILYPKPRAVSFVLEYDLDPGKKQEIDIIATQEGKTIPFSNGALLTPGKYHFSILANGYTEESLEKEVLPGEETFEIPLKLKAKEIEYTVYLQYEIPPHAGLKPPEFYSVEKEQLLLYKKAQESYTFFLPVDTKKVKVVQEGYEIAILPLSFANLQNQEARLVLVPLPRILSSWVEDSVSGKKIQPAEIKYLSKRYATGDEIRVKPGKVALEIQFKEYKEMKKTFLVPPGTAPFVIQHSLEPLQEFRFSVEGPFFSESLLFFIDKKRLSSYHAEYKKEGSSIRGSLYLTPKGRQLTIIHEFLSAEIDIMGRKHASAEWMEIRKDYLDVYLRLLQKEKGNSAVWDFLYRLVSDSKIQEILKKNKDLGIALQKQAQEDTFGKEHFYQKRILEILKSLYFVTGLNEEIWFKVKDKYQESTVSKVYENKEFAFTEVNPQGYLEYKHIKTGLVFVLIPGGTFYMGSSRDQGIRMELEIPQHQVTLDSFLIGKFEVSQKFLDKSFGLSYWFPGDNIPVHNISWERALAFCQKYDMDLPTEAEWEYACRANTSSLFYWGNDYHNDYLWCEQNSRKRLQNTGTKMPNAFGLHDMSGNIAEWCKDVGGRYTNLPQNNPTGPSPRPFQNTRVVRGGSYQMDAYMCRSAYRHFFRENYQGDIGFRPVWRVR